MKTCAWNQASMKQNKKYLRDSLIDFIKHQKIKIIQFRNN